MMSMTHYMELLANNQPWNLLLFMAIPVVLAETIAICELYLLYTRNFQGGVRTISKIAGVIAGFYFTGVFIYLLFHAVIPLSVSGQWRGPADIIAVFSYLAGVIPLLGIALIEINWLKRGQPDLEKLKLHAIFVGVFLVVAHIAMIFGMMSPEVLGYQGGGMGHMHMGG